MVLEWKIPFDGNRKISNFNLTYFINGSKLETTMRELLFSNMTSYNVTSLKPYSKYTFEMTATNEIGVSDVSLVYVNTSEDSKSFFIFLTIEKYDNLVSFPFSL